MLTPNFSTDTPPECFLQHSQLLHLHRLQENTLYHGTGRFAKGYDNRDKSRPNGSIVDVLDAILREGLLPQADIIARVCLPVEGTVSLTRQRIYARCYAQRFGSNDRHNDSLQYIFGSYHDWWNFFMREIYRQAKNSPTNLFWLPQVYRNIHTRFTAEQRRKMLIDQKEHSHLKKIGHESDSRLVQDWLGNQAFVSGNYPIIFGVDSSSISPVTLPRGVDTFEVRSSKPIPPRSIKFLEVPQSCLADTRKKLSQFPDLNILIFPLESAEASSWQKGVKVAIS